VERSDEEILDAWEYLMLENPDLADTPIVRSDGSFGSIRATMHAIREGNEQARFILMDAVRGLTRFLDVDPLEFISRLATVTVERPASDRVVLQEKDEFTDEIIRRLQEATDGFSRMGSITIPPYEVREFDIFNRLIAICAMLAYSVTANSLADGSVKITVFPPEDDDVISDDPDEDRNDT